MQTQGDEIKKIFETALKAKEKLIRTALADVPLVQLAGAEYARDFVARRKASEVKLKSLRLNGQSNTPDSNDPDKQVKTITLPTFVTISLVIWDDTVVLVNEDATSTRWITDHDHAEGIKAWYEKLWRDSIDI